ncbi:hypothetical protein [Thiomicrorhabdus lithotrophica]|uniref:START domain-containing protein n=1 Tax=Thiomicrorhabdus lithotrophica TaxID=2949997 RepID=A0ABY8CED3_9GAMM|nr:hypothetical protein [Thiomicrorhabdus lithotrophica]WEJ63602.1 hypothetical protein NR989_04935 [Thiomicrorhabdus lithotrophica]
MKRNLTILSTLMIFAVVFFSFVDRNVLSDSEGMNEKMRLKLGSYVADIPKDYFYLNNLYAEKKGRAWKPTDKRQEVNSVILWVDWPSMEPYDKQHPSGKISMVVSDNHNERWPYNFFKNVVSENKEMNTVVRQSKEAPGLMQYNFSNDSSDYYLDSSFPKPNLIRIICTREGEAPYPMCWRGNSEVISGVNVSYRFPRKHLRNWKKIDRSIKQLLFSFKVNKER